MISSLHTIVKLWSRFKYHNQWINQWRKKIVENYPTNTIHSVQSQCNLVIFVSLGYWFLCPSDLFYEHGESFNMHRRTEEEEEQANREQRFENDGIDPAGGNTGNPGHKLPPRGASRYGREEYFGCITTLAVVRPSSQPSRAVQWLARIRACARHYYLCARSYGRRMGGDGRACLQQPSQMASDWQLTHLCICSWAHFYSCADLCDRGYSRFDDILLDTFASAVSYLMLNGSACPIYIKCCKSLALSKRFWSDPIFPSSAGKVNESFDRQKIWRLSQATHICCAFFVEQFLEYFVEPCLCYSTKTWQQNVCNLFCTKQSFFGWGP